MPEWYQDAKFGIFIHWGVYCVPAFGNEWYPRNMYLQGTPEFEHHLKTYGPHSQSSATRTSSPCSRPRSSTRPRWADLFRKAGAKFVVPVAEHHDGFAMYDCSLSRLDGGQDGAQARHHRRAGRGGAQGGHGLRRLQPPRRALVVL